MDKSTLNDSAATAAPVPKPQPIAARYIKPGNFINGIPARDLTVDDWKALTDDQRADCLETGIYELAKGTPKPVRPVKLVVEGEEK